MVAYGWGVGVVLHYLIVGGVCLALGVAIGATLWDDFVRVVYAVTDTVRELLAGALMIAGIGLAVWLVLHFALHKV